MTGSDDVTGIVSGPQLLEWVLRYLDLPESTTPPELIAHVRSVMDVTVAARFEHWADGLVRVSGNFAGFSMPHDAVLRADRF